MTNTDKSTVDHDASSVKQAADARLYGIGLQVENDATHLAKKSPVELLREYDERCDSYDAWLVWEGTPRLIELQQAKNRVVREIATRMERGTEADSLRGCLERSDADLRRVSAERDANELELRLLRTLAAYAKDWQERDCNPSHPVNDKIREYQKAFTLELYDAMLAIGERPATFGRPVT